MDLTHLDAEGRARMVDIGKKEPCARRAQAEGWLSLKDSTRELLLRSVPPKGNPLEAARLAGIQAAKQTAQLIPLCHQIGLDFVDVEITLEERGFRVRSQVSCRWATGVEMEALVAVNVALLTLYDMCKAVDQEMVMGPIRLLRKEKGPAALA